MNDCPLPKRLKETRTSHNISQKQLGVAIDIDEFSASPRMNQYETGKHTPDFNTVNKLAQVLNVPTAYFYAEEDELARLILTYHRLDKSRKIELLKSLNINPD